MGTLFDYITNEGKALPFSLPSTEELRGRTALLPDGSEISFMEELAVKCDDDLFLAEKDGRIYLIEELADESLKAIDAAGTAAAADGLPADIEGWETDLSLASGNVLTATFRGGELTLGPSPEPDVVNPYSSSGKPGTSKTPAASDAPPVTFAVKCAETGVKRFVFLFPESGEVLFFNARRFLLYALLGGRIVTGFVEIPAR